MELLMTVDQTYLTDSDIFATEKNLDYSFDISSGFWRSGVTQGRADSSALTGFHHDTVRLRWLAKSKNSSDL